MNAQQQLIAGMLDRANLLQILRTSSCSWTRKAVIA
jgi:hypothetical protein